MGYPIIVLYTNMFYSSRCLVVEEISWLELFMSQYSRNTAKVSVKHQSMLFSMLSIFLPVIGMSMFSKIPAGFSTNASRCCCHHIQNQYVQGRFLLQFFYFKSPNQTGLDESTTSLVPHKPIVNFCLHMDEKY